MKVLIKELLIANRQRVEFGNVAKLAESMKRLGQIQPIVVAPLSAENQILYPDKKFKLIAGERRVRASILNGWLEAEAVLQEDCDELLLEEIELDENVSRKDLDWKEQIEAVRRIDAIKRKRFGDGSRSGSTATTGWTAADTAELIGSSKTSVLRDITLANALKDNPELLKAIGNMPKAAAVKMVAQKEEARKLQVLYEKTGKPINIDLRLGESQLLVDQLPDKSVHLWLTDPPFAVEAISDLAKTSANYNITKSNVSNVDDMTLTYQILIPKMFQKMVDGAHFYMFFGHSWYCRLLLLLRNAGFIVDDVPIIWDKTRPTVMAKDMHYLSSYCPILFGYKPPAKRILRKPLRNLLSIPMVAPGNRTHQLELPLDLLKIFIDNSSEVGETVVDTFAGSGSTIIAARQMQRNAIGFEMDQGNYIRALGNIDSILNAETSVTKTILGD